ncbi:MarR family winged helix-turn-helix transcriptional regulator [Rhodoblastus sp.]|uniref:MarR family winged helix-turn-helix transcriptional regulator n=1 Tax=Rhodoblastus sp. TaxID=1962975 RepID=UPI0035B34091
MDTQVRRSVEDLLRRQAVHWPEAATPAARLMVRLFRLRDLVLAHSSHLAAARGVSLTEFDVLAALRGAAPPYELTPTEVCAAVLLSSGGLTKVLRALEARGLVARGESPGDRRSVPVRLTEAGRETAERAMADILRADADLLAAALSQDDVESLTERLGRLLAWLEKPAPAKTRRKS